MNKIQDNILQNKESTRTQSSRKMPPKAAGRTKVQLTLYSLLADRLYTDIKRKPGPKRKLLSQKLRVAPKRVHNPYRSYCNGVLALDISPKHTMTGRF